MKKLPIKLPTGIRKVVGKAALKLRNVRPDICIIGGIACGVAATATAIVATWKNKETISNDIHEIKVAKAVGTTLEPELEPENGKEVQLVEAKRALTKEEKRVVFSKRLQLVKDVAKNYWLSASLSLGSIVLGFRGRKWFRYEVAALGTLLTKVTNDNNELIRRLREKYGDEAVQDILYGIKTNEYTNEETGEIEKHIEVDKAHNISPYAFYFDEGEFDSEYGVWIWKNPEWRGSKLYDQMRIMQCQRTFDDLLITRGWVLLAEVAIFLGAKPNPYWYHVGWVRKKGEEKHIELGVLPGIYQIPYNKAFMDEHNPQGDCIIDPNVDGCIDYIFENIELYDKRCGKRIPRVKSLPSNE